MGSITGWGSKITHASWCSQNIGGKKWSTYEPEQLHKKKEGQSRPHQGKDRGSRNGFCHQNKWILGLSFHFRQRLAWESTLPCTCLPATYILHTQAHPGQGHAHSHQPRGSLTGKLIIPRLKKNNCTYLTLKVESNHIFHTLKSNQYLTTAFLKHFPYDFFLGIVTVVRLNLTVPRMTIIRR